MRFHQSENTAIPDQELITHCCITAMNDDFTKEIDKNELQVLERSGIIKKTSHTSKQTLKMGLDNIIVLRLTE